MKPTPQHPDYRLPTPCFTGFVNVYELESGNVPSDCYCTHEATGGSDEEIADCGSQADAGASRGRIERWQFIDGELIERLKCQGTTHGLACYPEPLFMIGKECLWNSYADGSCNGPFKTMEEAIEGAKAWISPRVLTFSADMDGNPLQPQPNSEPGQPVKTNENQQPKENSMFWKVSVVQPAIQNPTTGLQEGDDKLIVADLLIQSCTQQGAAFIAGRDLGSKAKEVDSRTRVTVTQQQI